LGVAEIIISKHRNGATGDVHLTFRKELAKFSDMENQFGSSFGNKDQTFSSKMNEDENSNSDGISSNKDFDEQKAETSDAPF
jgi:replicative DNA helicase